MRLKCFGILNYYEDASKLAEKKYLKSLLPVPHLLHSANEAFGCDGSETFDKAWPLEVLTKYMPGPDTRPGDPAMVVDIKSTICFAEQFMTQLLPQPISYCIPDGSRNLQCQVQACAWIEDNLSTKQTGEGHPREREIEPYVQDLPEAWEFPNSDKEICSRTYLHHTEQFESTKQDFSTELKAPFEIEAAPVSSFLLPDEEYTISSPMEVMDGAGSANQPEEDHKLVVKTFQPDRINNECEEHFDEVPLHETVEEHAIAMVQIHTGHVHEDLGEPACVRDIDPPAFLLERYDPKLEVQIQDEDAQVVSGCNKLLEDVALTPIVSLIRQHQVQATFELPVIIEEANFGDSSSLKLGRYTADLIAPSFVALPDLGSLVASQSFESKLIVMPELTVDDSRFHSLPVPFFAQKWEARIAEDVFKALSRTKTLSPIKTFSLASASDWLCLDWHMSQVGQCNNYTCFFLRKILKEDQLCAPVPYETVSGKKVSKVQLLLLSSAEGSSPRNLKTPDVASNTEDYAEKVFLPGETKAPVSTSMLESGRSLCTGAKAAEKDHSDHSTLTDETVDSTTAPRLPSAVSDPTSMASVLSLVRQTRRGAIPKDNSHEEHGAFKDEFEHVHKVKGQSHVAFEANHRVTGAMPASGKSTSPLCSGESASINDPIEFTTFCKPASTRRLETPAKPPSHAEITPAPPLQPTPGELQSGLEEIQMSAGQGPHVILTANILEPDGPVLQQRRSSYQRILGLENEDLQVVERERQLPVDLILSPTTCLIIYTAEKLKLRWSDIRDPSSKAFLCSIANTVVDCQMKAMSFSFKMCFMIFEGEPAFTSAIRHITQKLYIAAAAFDMHLQCFISGDPKCTDDLLLKCVKRIWRTAKRPYDFPMSDCLTEGEVFLAQFPSLNPLAAHAILCLSVPLATFMLWSHEQQVLALEGYDVPTECLKLFKAQCEFGKLERGVGRGEPSAKLRPYASKAVTLEVDRHNLDSLSYFPPASELCDELDRDCDGPTRMEHSDLCSPPPNFRVDPFFEDLPAKQGTSFLDDPYWQPERGRPSVEPWYETSHLQLPNSMREKSCLQRPGYVQSLPRPNPLREKSYSQKPGYVTQSLQRPNPLGEKSSSQKPGYVQSSLDEWLQKIKKGKQSTLETEPELDCGSARDLKRASFLLQTQLDTFPTWASTAEALDPNREKVSNRRGKPPADTPSLKAPAKRNSSTLELYRHKKGLSTSTRPLQKKLKPAVHAHRARVADLPLPSALAASRRSCNRLEGVRYPPSQQKALR